MRQQLIKNIIEKQDNIDWDFHPEYYCMDKEELNSLSNNDLNEIYDTLSDIEKQEEERYDNEFIRHGRAE